MPLLRRGIFASTPIPVMAILTDAGVLRGFLNEPPHPRSPFGGALAAGGCVGGVEVRQEPETGVYRHDPARAVGVVQTAQVPLRGNLPLHRRLLPQGRYPDGQGPTAY